MSRQFNMNPKDSKQKSHFKEVLRVENGKVVTYINMDGKLVKKEEK